MADISPRKGASIVTFYQYNQASVRDISKTIGVPQTSVSRITTQYQTTRSVSPKRKEKCGRKRKITAKDDAYILKKTKQDPSKSSVEIRNDLAGGGVEISASLVRRRLVAMGRKAKRPSKKQLLKV